MSITYNEIQALYLGLLDRPADASGEGFWYSQTGSASSTANAIGNYAQYSPTDNGQSLTAITSSNITNEITNIYTNLLGVTPSAGNSGVAYWAGLYTAGTLSIGQIVDSIFNIVENLSSGSPYINEKIYMDKAIAAATSYTQANANVTYNAAAYLAEGQTIIATPVMQSVNLTTAIDNIAPVGNTNIYGTLGTDLNVAPGFGTDTLNPLDTIKATGSNNVLNITDQGNSTNPGTFNFSTVNVSGVQTANITSVVGESDLNVAGWTGLTALNVTASTGADAVTAAGTTAVAVTDTLATGTTDSPGDLTTPAATTILGGSTVNLTATGTASSSSTSAQYIGTITVGSSSSTSSDPTGAVSVTATETLNGTTGDTYSANAGAINVYGGTTQTINSTVNASINPTTQATIAASSAAGAVVINDNTVVTQGNAADNIILKSDAVKVIGGTTINVTENLTFSAAVVTAQAASRLPQATVTGGNVTISSSATTTAVTVTQTAAVAAANGAIAVPAGAGTPATAAQPGINAVAAVAGTPATAVVPGTLGVTDGTVTITDATGVITTVTLNNYGNSTFTATAGGALATVNLSGTAGTLTITEKAATATALTLNLNGVTAAPHEGDASDLITIDDEGTKITTLNVVAGATASTLTGLTDTSSALTTLNVSGSSIVTITDSLQASITTLNVTGAAGFNGNISETGITAFDPTSTGVITTTLDAATQTFTGGAGQDIVTINEDATKAITGGTATNNEIILEGGTYTAAYIGTNVTGFSTLGVGLVGSSSAVTVGSTTTGTVDMSVLSGTYDALVVYSGDILEKFINVAAGTSLALVGGGDTIVYTVAGASGPTDTVGITLGTANSSGTTTTSLTLADSNSVGIGTVNVVSNASSSSLFNTITTLIDNGLAKLTVSGAAGLAIGTLSESTTEATSMTINNTSAGEVAIGALSDSNLGTLNFTGTGLSIVTNLNDLNSQFVSISNNGTGGTVNVSTLTDTYLTHLSFAGTGAVDVQTISGVDASTLTIANTGTGAATVGDFADTALTSLTLTGNVAIGTNTLTSSTVTGATSGVTVSGSTDNAHININLTGAAAGSTDSITLGNGNDYITDGSTAGTVNVTVGTGSNLINLSAGGGTFSSSSSSAPTANNTYAAAVTLGTHTSTTGSDVIQVGVVDGTVTGSSGSYEFAPIAAANTVITGAVTGDQLIFTDTSTDKAANVTATQQAAITAANNIGAAVTLAFGETAAHEALSFQYGGNTYVVEQAGATNAALYANDSIVELVGTHTLSTTLPSTDHIALA